MIRTLAIIAIAAGTSLAPTGESSEANASFRYYGGHRGGFGYHRSYRPYYGGYGYRSPYVGRSYGSRYYGGGFYGRNYGYRGYGYRGFGPGYYGHRGVIVNTPGIHFRYGW